MKNERITKENKAYHWRMLSDRMLAEKQKNSTGWVGKFFEIRIRDLVYPFGICWTSDLRSRSNDRDDLTVTDKNGVVLHLETKQGAGSIAYAEKFSLASFDTRDPDLCLRDDRHGYTVDFVLYYINGDYLEDNDDLLDNVIVCTRDQFLQALCDYCHGPRKSGWETAVKFGNGKHDCINIQSQYLSEFMDGMETELYAGNFMSLRTFMTEVLGREP